MPTSRRTTAASSSHCCARPYRRSSATSAGLFSRVAPPPPSGRWRWPPRAGRSPLRRRARGAGADRSACAGRRSSRARSANRFGQLGPVPRLRRQPIELAEHVLVGRIDAQRAPVDVEGGVLVRQAPLLDLRHPAQQLDLARRLLGLRLHHLVDGDDPIPLAGALVDRLQHLRRQHRRLGLAARHERFQRADRRLVRRVHASAPGGRPPRRAPDPSGARATARRCGSAARPPRRARAPSRSAARARPAGRTSAPVC